MRLRGLATEQNLILNFLYELKDTIMTPPDTRISRSGIAQSFGLPVENIIHHLDGLKEKGFILPFRIGEEEFYKITLAGVCEVEKRTSTMVEGELSTSKIGVKSVRKKVIG